jgi:hypothetical protein
MQTPDIRGVCLTVIVDVGASKTKVALVHSDRNSVRELQTVGSMTFGVDVVRDAIVTQCLTHRKNLGRHAREFLAVAATRSLRETSRIIVSGFGNGELFQHVISEDDIAEVSTHVVKELSGLLAEIADTVVSRVLCIGTETLVHPINTVVRATCPVADIRHLDPDQGIVLGAVLDSAQRIARLHPD